MSGQFGTGAEVSYGHFGTSAEMSWVRSVLGPKCLDTPVFAGNEAAPFLGIRERKMTGILGCPGNRRPGMKTLHLCVVQDFCCVETGE